MKSCFAPVRSPLARSFALWIVLLFGVTAPGFAQANLGQVNVGSSVSSSVTVTVTTAGVLGSISVRMMGAEGLDFTNAGGGSCATGTAYAVNTTCTVNVGFAPRLAGQRKGARWRCWTRAATCSAPGMCRGSAAARRPLF